MSINEYNVCVAYKSHFSPPLNGYNNRLTVYVYAIDSAFDEATFSSLSDVYESSGGL